MTSSPVTLLVYDLSQGMARMLSPMLAGRQIDGIWHTSVVVYGREYFFGQGIMSCPPGQSMHGTPLERVDMGTTMLPREVVMEYIETLRGHWTADKYHLLDNNCNSFTNEVCQFLVGKTIPAHITGLPADFLNTPLGQQLRPMIEAMFGPSAHGQGQQAIETPLPARAAPPVVGGSSTGLTVDTSAAASSTAIIETRSLAQLNSLITSRRAVVVFFTREGCGPCKMIEPELKNLVDEINSSYEQAGRRRTSGSGVKQPLLTAARVDTGVAFDAAQYHQITATPTFKLFQDGKPFYEFKGANQGELKMCLYNLVGTTYPAHKHGKIGVPTLASLGSQPISYPPVAEVGKLVSKLKQFVVDEAKLASTEEWDKVVPNLLECLGGDVQPKAGWETFLSKLVAELDKDRVFPVLDLLRMLSDKCEPIRTWILQGSGGGVVMQRVRELGVDADTPKPARLTLLKLACNLPSTFLFSSSQKLKGQIDGEPSIPYRSLTTAMLVESLLHSDASVRQSAASLAWNASITDAATREGSGLPAKLAMALEDETEEEREEWVVELVSAVGTALEREKESEEVKLRLLGALLHFVRFSSESVVELVGVLGVVDLLKAETGKEDGDKDPKVVERRKKVAGLVKELGELTK